MRSRKIGDLAWAWRCRLRAMLDPGREEREVAAEMAHHLELEVRERIAAGMSPAEARRTAGRDFGGIEVHRSVAREQRFGRAAELWLRDVRLGARRLRRSPGFTLLAAVSLAVGVGAAAAIWSLGRSLLAAPWPYPEADRIVAVVTSWSGKPDGGTSPAELVDFEERLGGVFEAVGATASGTVTISGRDGAERISGTWLGPGTFAALGVRPALGRWFTVEESRSGAAVVILSHGAWAERFGADPDVLGRTLVFPGGEAEVVGVMPAGFDLPESLQRGEPSEAFFPLAIDPARITNRGSHYLQVYARIAPGVPVATARAEVEGLARAFESEHPSDYPPDMQLRLTLASLDERFRGALESPVAVLAGAVAFLFLVALANVGGLLLARVEGRSRELALAVALGAGRGHLVRQVALESALLALVAGLGGIAFARLGLGALRRLLPPEVAHLVEPAIDPSLVLVAALATALATGFLGLVPLAALRRGALADPLRRAGRGLGGSVGGRRLRRGLVAAQVAVTLVLLTAAGLLARSFAALTAVDPGYRTRGLAATRISPPPRPGESSATVIEVHRRLAERVAAQPGIRAATAARYLVLDDRPGDMDFEVEGRPVPPGRDEPAADWQVVLPGYFETLGVPLVAGRALDARDDAEAPGALVVDRTFVARHFPDEDPLGRRIRLGGENTGPRWATIVGVVGDVRHARLDESPHPRMYFAHAQFRFWSDGEPARTLHLIVDTDLPLAAAGDLIRRAAAELDPTMAVDPLRSVEALRGRALGIPRLLAALPAAFGILALFLATVGLYGVVAGSVVARRPEIGLRRALGARPRQLAGLVLREAVVMAAAGLLVGGGLAVLLARWLEATLYATSGADPAAWLAVLGCLVLAVVVASVAPVRRALGVDPARLLRQE